MVLILVARQINTRQAEFVRDPTRIRAASYETQPLARLGSARHPRLACRRGIASTVPYCHVLTRKIACSCCRAQLSLQQNSEICSVVMVSDKYCQKWTNILWEDRTYDGGDKYYILNYYLSDGKVEVKEINTQNSG